MFKSGFKKNASKSNNKAMNSNWGNQVPNLIRLNDIIGFTLHATYSACRKGVFELEMRISMYFLVR